jgi:hypothetical protein
MVREWRRAGSGLAVIRQGYLIDVVVAFLIGGAVLLVVGCAGVRSDRTEGTEVQARSPEATTSEEARCKGTRTFKEKLYLHGGPRFITNDVPWCPNKGGLLSGTDGPDKLDGKMGDDEIRGLGAQDDLAGGLGSDVIYGGPGDDFMRGNTYMGDDRNRAKDVLHGGPGRDNMLGEEGDDVLYGGDGNDKGVPGGKGADDAMGLYGGPGEDVLYGGDGNDFLDDSGDGDRDKLYCGEGTDEYLADNIDYVDSSCEAKMSMKGVFPLD